MLLELLLELRGGGLEGDRRLLHGPIVRVAGAVIAR
jgi:hypothetical protein